MKTPHVHADLIKQWADGAEIEAYWEKDKTWFKIETPLWTPTIKHRVKPQNVVRYGHWLPRERSIICWNTKQELNDTIKVTLSPDSSKIIAIELLPTTE